MLFHTWIFAVFFVIVYAGYLLLRRTRYWLHWLLVASYVFYGQWNPWYLLLIGYSTLVDYLCVRQMHHGGRRGFWLATSLVNNLGVLAFFKYSPFFAENLNSLLAWTGAGYSLQWPAVVLPVGISFFTFQSMSYTIDYYRNDVDYEPSLVRYATFVSFFPQLVAGPIERSSALLPQLRSAPTITRQHLADGFSLFVTGLAKKVIYANFLSAYADPIYANPASQSPAALVLATIAFAWQIYFDFSGYTDMARGVAQAMGFDLMLNFYHPYLATSLRDFWSRWHISLSSWFRDYVYIPLGGNRGGPWMTSRNLFLTMVISGFWHGAAWTFLIWGALHGAAYVLMRPLENARWYRERVPAVVKQAGIFTFVCLTWVFFRAASVEDAWLILTRIATGVWTDPRFPLLAAALLVMVVAYQWLFENVRLPRPATTWLQGALIIALLLYISFVPGRGDQPFIYFQF